MGEYTDNGVYIPDANETGWDDEVNTNLNLLDETIETLVVVQNEIDDITVGTGPQGDPGVAGSTDQMFRQSGEVTLATGSEGWPLPFDADILNFRVSATLPPSDTDVVIDALVNDVSVWSSESDRATLPFGQLVGSSSAPDDTEYDENDLVTIDIVGMGAPSSGDESAMDVVSVSTPVSSFSTTKSNVNVPIPPVYHVGNLLLFILATLSQTVVSLPADWFEIPNPTLQEEEDHPGSLNIYMYGKEAENSESAVQNFVFSGGTPMLAITLAINNPLAIEAQPDDSTSDFLGTASGTFGLGGVTSSGDDTISIYAYACRFLVAGTSELIDLDDDLVTDFSDFTTRSTQNNIGMAVGHILMPVADSSADYDATVPVLLPRWVGRSVNLFRGAVGDSPGENVTVHMLYRQRT